MKIAYFDCLSGISGDMTVAAFLDAGLGLPTLKKGLKRLGLKGYDISSRKVTKSGLSGTKFDVRIKERRRPLCVTYKDVRSLINKSRLANEVKKIAQLIFEKLAKAEAKVHNEHREKIHFHEIGDIDSIVDIVSTAIAVTEMGIERFYCLNLNLGIGNISSRHGVLPLPAPAVLEMLKGKPVSFLNADYELVTPTGAAILTALVEDFTERPAINPVRIGYGAGTFSPKEMPNLLRVILGDSSQTDFLCDTVCVMETNIDDASPLVYEYLIERLFEEGALDAYLTPIYMKKARPAVVLTVLTKGQLLDKLAALIMRETTTSGIRYYTAERRKLDRIIKTVDTKYGRVRVKVNTGPVGIRTVSPEYEDCKRIARAAKVPLKRIFDECVKREV